MTATWTKTFPGEPEAVRVARRWVDSLLDGCPVAGDVVLLLSETATNALRHSRSGCTGGEFTVNVTLDPATVRVEVVDQGGPAVPRIVSVDGRDDPPAGGRGLRLLDAFADVWTVRGDSDGRVVSFTVSWKDLTRRP